MSVIFQVPLLGASCLIKKSMGHTVISYKFMLRKIQRAVVNLKIGIVSDYIKKSCLSANVLLIISTKFMYCRSIFIVNIMLGCKNTIYLILENHDFKEDFEILHHKNRKWKSNVF